LGSDSPLGEANLWGMHELRCKHPADRLYLEEGIKDRGSTGQMVNPSKRPSPRAEPQPTSPPGQGHLSRLVAIFLRIAPWLGVALLLAIVIRDRFGGIKPAPSASPGFAQGKPGPWGQLEYETIREDLPDESVPVPPPDQPPIRWVFQGYSKEQAIDFLRSAGITPAQLDYLRKAGWEPAAEGVSVTPDDELILSLAPDARANIYSLLVSFPANSRQIDPLWFRKGHVEERLKDSGLSPSSVTLLKSLLYPHGQSSLLFVDMGPALRRIADDRERSCFVATVSRKRTLLARLRVGAESNLDSIIDYWSVGGRRRDVAPLLKALHHEGDATVSVLALLPPFARERLYVYPSLNSGGTEEGKQDCFWSAWNFFNSPPDNHYNDIHHVETLNKYYHSIPAPTQLGDMVFLTTQDGVPIHAAVYVADDIVFTKNGESISQPWILAHMQDMIDEFGKKYPPDTPPNVYWFRKNSL
jgi:hypothetical protein